MRPLSSLRSLLLPLAVMPMAVACWPGPEVGEKIDPLTSTPCGSTFLPPDGGGPAGPGFAVLMTTVFTPSCATSFCHQADPPPVAPMTMTPAKAYEELVGVPSSQLPSMLRVKPFDPENSYLILKLRSGGTVSTTRMPLNLPPLDETVIKDIEAWIARGAPND